MKIKGLRRREVVQLFTNARITDDAAEKMADLVIAEGVEDTNDISFNRWIEMTDQATGAKPEEREQRRYAATQEASAVGPVQDAVHG